MKWNELCSATLLLTLAAACGPMPAEPGLRAPAARLPIINGERCGPETEASAVAVLVDALLDVFGMEMPYRGPICTGTLIAPDTVMVAAHCFETSALTMGMGTVRREQFYASFTSDLGYMVQDQNSSAELPADAIPASEWIGHPQFDLEAMTPELVHGPGDWKDVGLMFLERPVTGVTPEYLITQAEADQLVAQAPVTIAGWGQQTQTTSSWEPPPAGTVGVKVCAASFINEVGAYEMQIGGDSSTARKCHGDSGGPTYMEIDGAAGVSRRVVGITSHAYDDSDCAKGGVDTRVDVWLSWIDQQMSARCDEGSRAWCDVDGVVPPSYDWDSGEIAPDGGSGGTDGGNDGDDANGGGSSKQDDDEPEMTLPWGCGALAPAQLSPGLAALLLLALRRRARA